MKKIENKRIENLEFRPSSYLLPREKWPEHIGYSIDYWYPNAYYGKEEDYDQDPRYPDWYYVKGSQFAKVHKDCFKHPESCMAVGLFEYNEHEECYEFSFVGDRPVQLTEKERQIFWVLVEYGFEKLNKPESKEEVETTN